VNGFKWTPDRNFTAAVYEDDDKSTKNYVLFLLISKPIQVEESVVIFKSQGRTVHPRALSTNRAFMHWQMRSGTMIAYGKSKRSRSRWFSVSV
jgi:hypothetical protein